MIRSRGPLAAILLAVLFASCGGRPSVTVRIAGDIVPTRVLSTTQATPCSASHGDAFLPPAPPTIVRSPPPLAIGVDVESGSDVRGWIYDEDSPTPSGGPLEEFTLTTSGTYVSRSIVPSRTYNVVVNVVRSALGFRTEVTHGFRLRVQPP